MNIYSLKGHKVICKKLHNGYDYHKENAIKYLQIDAIYTIEKTVINKYCTNVYLQEIPNIEFNSVFFEDVYEQSKKDDKKHLDYFRYNKWWQKESIVNNKKNYSNTYIMDMESKKLLRPSIYYVVQGRATDNDTDYIEHVFMDVNPLNARERAFSYLEYYVQLLNQGKKIFFKEKEKIVDVEIKLEYLNNYSVSFAENNFGLDGISIYMVVNEPIEYMDKMDNAEDRFLIYAVQNLSETKIEFIKNSLVREYGYYRHSKINTSLIEDSISFITKPKFKLVYQSNIIYTILKTPFDFFFAKVKNDDMNLYNARVAQDFKVIDLQKTTFISNLDWHTIRVQITSFLNTDGGKVYLGKVVNNKIINCINETSITKCTNLLNKNILSHFPKHKHFLSFRFVKINKILVPIIEIKGSYRKFCFYDNDTNNNFYFRSNKGLEKMNETEKIAEYVVKNSEYRLSDLNDILDKL